jgi:hypothetical protein
MTIEDVGVQPLSADSVQRNIAFLFLAKSGPQSELWVVERLHRTDQRASVSPSLDGEIELSELSILVLHIFRLALFSIWGRAKRRLGILWPAIEKAGFRLRLKAKL